jgi:hypothetical protein
MKLVQRSRSFGCMGKISAKKTAVEAAVFIDSKPGLKFNCSL